MTDTKRQRSGRQKERYTIGYDASAVQIMQRRTAARDAEFFLPYLHPGMSLLDCGCGPGTITAGLAEVVAPGQVVGIDREVKQIKVAQSHEAAKDISNLRFEIGNVYELAFPDKSFDAVFSSAVVVHLRYQLRALREMYRVLRPGGVIGIKNADYGGYILACSDPLVNKGFKLFQKLLKHNGANLLTGRQQRGLLHKAGFVRVEGAASYSQLYGTPESVRKFSTERKAVNLTIPDIADQVVKLGWVDRSELKKINAAWKAWGESPDAFLAFASCSAVGWKN